MKSRALSALLVFALSAIAQSTSIPAKEAKDHIGESASVCGIVAGTRFADSRGRNTFLDLDKAYPHEVFTVVIWSSDRSKFGQPEFMYRGKQICVFGIIWSYHGTPEIIAQEPKQIEPKPVVF